MLVVGISFYIWAFTKPPLPPELDHVDHYEEGGPMHMGHDSPSCIPTRWSAVSDATATATDRPRIHVGAPRMGGADARSGPFTALSAGGRRRSTG